MPLIIIATIVTAAALTAGITAIVNLIRKKKGKKLGKLPMTVIFIAMLPVSLVCGFLGYTAIYYHADEKVNEYLVSGENFPLCFRFHK